MTQTSRAIPLSAFGPDARSVDTPVLDSHIHHIEHGDGDPIVFLHGSPTSSYLWRHVFTRLAGRGRLIAADLIGFGDSGRPDIAYELDDNVRYLDAWFEALDLRRVTLVLQDYGAAFGIDWAAKHPDRVKAVLLAEPVLRDIASADLPEPFVQAQQLIRTPGDGEKFVVDDNLFLTQVLPGAFLEPPAQEDLDVYLAPFPTAEGRGHLIRFPRNLPIDGDPAGTVEFLDRSAEWLGNSTDVPKLLLTFEPGFLLTPEILAWATTHIADLEVRAAGPGVHFVQEEQPQAIADGVVDLLARAGDAR
ncbi:MULTISPECIES: haloalkane dehalogenase [unclassified Gordonia (in: high G+C Gram-positive bacteria)]|uniref:haloalkane dehalogenase n=1 Tax=unclassified Gordonia (in: high G+C Gram-positive bacteria) TaxID=2657482 RepID=UPI0010F7CFD6|nr:MULTISPECIES: haloalkane dehalogenase [unclassified Gordonia (in: high G+C Gram-positive bacteria)]